MTLLDGLNYYVIYCDASRVSIGFVFMQLFKFITYPSIELKMDDKNYPSLTRAYSGGVCPLDLETLLVWCSCRCVYRP